MKLIDAVRKAGERAFADRAREKNHLEEMRKKKEELKRQAKLKKEKKKKLKQLKKQQKEQEEIRQALLKEEGMDLFFRGDSYVPAHPDEYEGHYPGNQNNAIVIPYKSAIPTKEREATNMTDKKGWD